MEKLLLAMGQQCSRRNKGIALLGMMKMRMRMLIRMMMTQGRKCLVVIKTIHHHTCMMIVMRDVMVVVRRK